ncbi:MAG: radical SAM protein [Planctomycetes bacterium]|nr:radical SAM protein [Planctomycetota bacterium]
MAGLKELCLELTDRCPQGCLHCSSSSGPSCTSMLSTELVCGLIQEAAALGADRVSFGGGEPFCAPLFHEAAEAVAGRGLRAEVYTCGVRLTDGRVQPLERASLARLVSLPNFTLVFSLHAADSGLHDSITRLPGSLAATRTSLEDSLRAGLQCEINFVPMRPNAGAFEQVLDLARELGIRKVSVLRFVPQGRGLYNRSQLELSRDEEDAFVERLLILRSRVPLEIRTGSPFNGIVPGNAVPCRAGAQKLVVQADGNVLPCEVFKHRQTRDWGLSAHHQSLRDILRAPQVRALRALLHRAHCLACPVHSALRSAEATGSPHDAHQRVSESALHV